MINAAFRSSSSAAFEPQSSYKTQKTLKLHLNLNISYPRTKLSKTHIDVVARCWSVLTFLLLGFVCCLDVVVVRVGSDWRWRIHAICNTENLHKCYEINQCVRITSVGILGRSFLRRCKELTSLVCSHEDSFHSWRLLRQVVNFRWYCPISTSCMVSMRFMLCTLCLLILIKNYKL